jgi:hypothetical protein
MHQLNNNDDTNVDIVEEDEDKKNSETIMYRVRRRRQQEERDQKILWIDGFDNVDMVGKNIEPPWEQLQQNDEEWQQTIREVRNFVTGILWLLIARGFIVQCLRVRYRSGRMTS